MSDSMSNHPELVEMSERLAAVVNDFVQETTGGQREMVPIFRLDTVAALSIYATRGTLVDVLNTFDAADRGDVNAQRHARMFIEKMIHKLRHYLTERDCGEPIDTDFLRFEVVDNDEIGGGDVNSDSPRPPE